MTVDGPLSTANRQLSSVLYSDLKLVTGFIPAARIV
jgi:hypothetical protein